MMVKQMFNHKKIHSGFTKEAPFSRFYRDYFFISMHALEQMYYGVSEKAVYVGFSSIFKSLLGKSFSAKGIDQRNFRPLPDLYLPQNEFRAYLRPLVEGNTSIFGYKQGTFKFNFFGGLYLYAIWKLGGGNRFIPLHDPTRLFQFYGFYDLKFTPLAVIFKLYIKILFFFNRLSGSTRYGEYYLFNQRSLAKGFAQPDSFFSRNCDGNIHSWFKYFIFPLLYFPFEFLAAFIFNVFLRTFYYRIVMRRGRIQDLRTYDLVRHDYSWLRLYVNYLKDVVKFYQLKDPKLDFKKSIKKLLIYRFISAYFGVLYDTHMLYRTKRYNRLFFSIYTYVNFLFAPKYSLRFFHFLELKKFNKFKQLVLLDTEKSYFKFISNNFFAKFKFNFINWQPSEYLQLFKSKFLFFDFPNYLTEFADFQKWTVGELKKKRFWNRKWDSKKEESYKNFDNTKFNFNRSGELSRIRFLLDETISVSRLFIQVFEKFVNFLFQFFFAIFTIFFYRQFKRFSRFIFEKVGLVEYSIYGCFIKFSTFYVRNSILLNYLFTTVNFTNKSILYVYSVMTSFYSRIFYTVYYAIFMLFSLFIYLYYEVRYLSIFFIEYLRQFLQVYNIYGAYSTHYDYLGVFKKYFIGAKFFRFFTREVGEDLEETPLNMADDLEDEYVADYLNSNPAYFDFQEKFIYDSHYSDDEDGFELDGYNAHYFDYWLPTDNRFSQEAPFEPTLEFCAEEYLSSENEWFFQLVSIWINPTLAELSTNATETLPYEIKDSIDDFLIKPGDWFPNETAQSGDYDEDHLEYYLESSYDQSELSETSSMLPIPFDADRAKLINFTKIYNKKLKIWHSYQVNNNFVKVPAVLKLTNIPAQHRPTTLADWRKATLVASEFFLSKQEFKQVANSSKTNNVLQINLVWERIAYEIEKNPRKLYAFLEQKSSDFDVFKNLFFKDVSKSSGNDIYSKFTFFNKSSSGSSNLIEFLGDYFLSQAGIDVFKNNSNFKISTRYDILYSFYLFQLFASKDFSKFYSKVAELGEFSNFSELYQNFIRFSRHTPKDFQVTKPAAVGYGVAMNTGTWAGTIYENRYKILERRISLPKIFDYVHKGWDYFWHYYMQYRRTKRWPRKPTLTYGWRKLFIFRRTELVYPNSHNNRVGYETVFSLFLEENFFFSKFSSKNKKFSRAYARLFAGYFSPDIYYFAADGEDYDIHKSELHDDPSKQRERRRSYFSVDQMIEADIWNTLNPYLDELFYELYYLNSNIFFPTQFSDNLFEEVLVDDEIDSSQDIYDDYVYIGGVDDFDRNLGANREEYIVNEDELLDDDPDTLDASDESLWDEYDHSARLDEGLVRGQETGGEAPDHYSERFWYNSDQLFKLEHIDNDEGLEEWEFDEYEAMYDVDLSLDRFFFGGLKRSGSFPATDQRIFLGTLWENSLDKDLDYSHNFNLAKKNAESTELAVLTTAQKDFSQVSAKAYFYWPKLVLLYTAKFFIFTLYYFDYAITSFFSTSSQPAAVCIRDLKIYDHYLRWYNDYTAFYKYKSRVLDWIKFFESFESEVVFSNYKKLHTTFLSHEFQNFSYLSNPYGRFWLQFPFNNYLNEFAQYNDANMLYTDPFYYDYLIGKKDQKVHLFPKDIDRYYSNFTKNPLTGGITETIEKKFFDVPHRFFASNPTYRTQEVRHYRKKKMMKLTSYPWFVEGSRNETLGSDFIYMDLNFVEDMPEDDEFFDYHTKEFAYGLLPTYNQHTDFFFKWVEQRRSGAGVGHHLPNDGILDGYSLEEIDWDIGTMVSYSVDDFNSHLDEFSKKSDIFFNAVSDFFDLFADYTSYYIHSKARVFILAPFRYWETQSNSQWLALASRYGIWVLFFRNFINFSIFIAFFIYGFFVITRLFYFFFGEFFSYGLYSFTLFFSSFFFIVLLARVIFKPFNDFYKSLDFDEKLEVILFMLFAWYFYNLNGYVRGGHVIWTEQNGADTTPLLTNNFSADFRENGGDYTMQTGFTHRPELNKQGWLFRKATIAPRIYKTQYHPGYDELSPDRHYWWYNFGVASYPTYFNPYNFFNFMRFHVFNITNENFVGFKEFKRYKYEPTGLQVADNAHIMFHRPQIINWMHMHTKETKIWMKEQIMDHAYAYLGTTNPHLYVGLTSDRLKYNNIMFTNPVNPRPYSTAPHTFFSADRPSHLPYDFRPKFITEAYSRSENFKVNSNVYNNFNVDVTFNKLQRQPNNNSFLFYPDKPVYTLEEGNDKRVLRLKTSKYKRSLYKSFRSKNYFTRFNRYTLFDSTANVRWAQNKIFSNNFSFDYATNFRKYMLYYNPERAQSLRDVYGFSIRDVVPYPELLNSDKSKIPNLFFNDVFIKITKKERAFIRALLQFENEAATRTALFHALEFQKSKRPNYFLYASYNTTPPHQLSATFYKDYMAIFKKLSKRLKKTVAPTSPEVTAPKYIWYVPLVKYDEFRHNFADVITRIKFEKVNTSTVVFENILKDNIIPIKKNFDVSKLSNKFKFLRIKQKKSTQTKFGYLSKLVFANRMRRARLANSYFRSAKASSKFSTQDFFREYSFILDPQSVTKFSYNSEFSAYAFGFPEKNPALEYGIYDSYYRRRNPEILMHSAQDDRGAISSFNKDLINFASYEHERRNFVNKRSINNLKRNKIKYFEQSFSELAWWDYFLEVTYINRFLGRGYSNVVQPYVLPHKYIQFFYTTNRRARINYYSDGSMSNYNFDTHVLKPTSWLRTYNNEQKKINRHFNRSFAVTYHDDETIEHLIRYTYADNISGIERPHIEGNRLNLRKPHMFARLRRNHWYEMHTVPSRHERHKKPFFGPSTIPEDYALHGGKKYQFEFKTNAFTAGHHLIRGYLWSNFLQRVRVQYPKKFKDAGVPANQKFLELFSINAGAIENFFSDYNAPIEVRTWEKQLSDRFALPQPYNFSKPENFAIAFKGNGSRFGDMVERDHKFFEQLKQRAIAKNKLKIIKSILENKKKVTKFHKRVKSTSTYFKKLHDQAGYDMREQAHIVKRRDMQRYREVMFMGIDRADEEKGEAEIILFRAKKCLASHRAKKEKRLKKKQ